MFNVLQQHKVTMHSTRVRSGLSIATATLSNLSSSCRTFKGIASYPNLRNGRILYMNRPSASKPGILPRYSAMAKDSNSEEVVEPITQKLPEAQPAKKERFREFFLADKVFLVTGGARGLGLTMAEALVEAGGTGQLPFETFPYLPSHVTDLSYTSLLS